MNERDRLQKYLRYEASTGQLFWIKPRSNQVVVGQQAGYVNSKGYVVVHVNGQSFYAHRIAWLFVYGDWPTSQIDHINQNKQDNRIENLRDVSARANSQNRKQRDLPMGVHRVGRGWIARITVKKENVHLGTFNSPEEAYMAYFAAAKECGL